MKKDGPAANQGEETKLGKFSKKRNKNGGDDDESPVRTRVREFI